MEVYRTEEEQIDFIKRWWKNNGSSVVTGIAVAVAIAVGWQTWHQREQAKSESDSLLFSQVQDAARAAMAAPAEEGKESPQRATFKHLVKQMKDEHAGTSYSVLTAMLAARDAVEQGDAVTAETELRWALSQSPSEGLRLLIIQRLARVLAMKGEVDAGLTLMQGVDPGAQKGLFEEVRGDLLLMKGDKDKAREAYKTALGALDEKAQNRGLLEVKLNDLAVNAE